METVDQLTRIFSEIDDFREEFDETIQYYLLYQTKKRLMKC